jgi:phosphatidylinositol glycan class K
MSASIFNNAHSHRNLYLEDTEVDYRGYEVTAENLVRLLTGRLSPATPRNKLVIL